MKSPPASASCSKTIVLSFPLAVPQMAMPFVVFVFTASKAAPAYAPLALSA